MKRKKTKTGKFLRKLSRIGLSVLNGAGGGTIKPLVGAVKGLREGIKQEIDNNVNSTTGGEGKVDWIRLTSLVATLVLIALVVMGKIDLDTFEQLLDAVKE